LQAAVELHTSTSSLLLEHAPVNHCNDAIDIHSTLSIIKVKGLVIYIYRPLQGNPNSSGLHYSKWRTDQH